MSGAPTPNSPASFTRAERSIRRPPRRLALRRDEVAAALGVSEETFDRHVRPSLPVARLGQVRVYPVAALEAWLAENSSAPLEELER